jgi:hypothetical protein
MSIDGDDAITYYKLFDEVSENGKLSGRKAVPFLQKSNLDRSVLKKIWTVGSAGAMELSRETFINVMRLVALAQNGGDPNSLSALNNKILPLAKLEGVSMPKEIPSEKYLRLRTKHFAGVFQYLVRQSNSGNMTLHGKVVAVFFLQSNLPNSTLRDVWNIAVQGKQVMFMDFQAFARGMDLVQRAQQGLSITDLSVPTPPGYPVLTGVPVSPQLVNVVQLMKRTSDVTKKPKIDISIPKEEKPKDVDDDNEWGEFSTSPTKASSTSSVREKHEKNDDNDDDWGEFSKKTPESKEEQQDKDDDNDDDDWGEFSKSKSLQNNNTPKQEIQDDDDDDDDDDWGEFSSTSSKLTTTTTTTVKTPEKDMLKKTPETMTALKQDDDDWGEFSSSSNTRTITNKSTIDNLIENSFEGALQEVKKKNTPLSELKRMHNDVMGEVSAALVSKEEAEAQQNKMAAFDIVVEEEKEKNITTTPTTTFVKKEVVLYLLKPEGSIRATVVGVHTDDPTETYYTIQIGSDTTSREKGTIESRILKARQIDPSLLFKSLLESEDSVMVSPASVVSAFRDSRLTRAQLRTIWNLSSQHDAACHNGTRSNGLRFPGFVFALHLIALIQSGTCDETIEKMDINRAKDLVSSLEQPVALFSAVSSGSSSSSNSIATTPTTMTSQEKRSETHSQYFERLWVLVTGSEKNGRASPSTLVHFFKKSGLDRKTLRDIWTASTTIDGVKQGVFNRDCFERSLILIAKAQQKDVPTFEGVSGLYANKSLASDQDEDWGEFSSDQQKKVEFKEDDDEEKDEDWGEFSSDQQKKVESKEDDDEEKDEDWGEFSSDQQKKVESKEDDDEEKDEDWGDFSSDQQKKVESKEVDEEEKDEDWGEFSSDQQKKVEPKEDEEEKDEDWSEFSSDQQKNVEPKEGEEEKDEDWSEFSSDQQKDMDQQKNVEPKENEDKNDDDWGEFSNDSNTSLNDQQQSEPKEQTQDPIKNLLGDFGTPVVVKVNQENQDIKDNDDDGDENNNNNKTVVLQKDFDAFSDLVVEDNNGDEEKKEKLFEENEENPCDGMTWPFVGDAKSLLKTLCTCGRALDALECFEYVELKSQIESLRQATKEAAMDERFEDALRLKKQRIEVESKLKAFSEAEIRWRGMPTYQSTMYHLRRQVEKIATSESDLDNFVDICKSFLSRHRLPPLPLTVPDTIEDGAHDTLRKLAENQRKALFSYHVISRLKLNHIRDWNRILNVVLVATRDVVKTVSSLNEIEDEDIINAIRNDSTFDRFVDSVASMHSVADLIRVAADATSCKSVLERLDEIETLSSSIGKILETRKTRITFQQWSEFANREILKDDGKFCCVSLVPMGENVPTTLNGERPYVVAGDRIYYSGCAKILISLAKEEGGD